MENLRTRFAPSPTGLPHVGNIRTAIYAWLLARRHGGQFILRVEDTDKERRVEEAVQYMIKVLQWFDIDIDEGPTVAELKAIDEYWEGAPELGGAYGPYVQSQRLERYKAIADQLIASGHAYRCDCTPELLKKDREEQQARKETPGYSGRCRERGVGADTKHVVRFKMPEAKTIAMQDAVRGDVSWDKPSLRDPVLLKSDGFPTYHLACIVDDHDMQVSHVMRGEEWLSSAPLHILIYEALGWEKPVFCHLSTILGKNGKKLSKREGAMSLDEFKEKGYLPQALLNYIVLIGWNPGEGEEQEIFSKEELCRRFSLEHLSKAGGVFDTEKLLWMNGVYIRNLSDQDFTLLATPYIGKAGLKFKADIWAMVVSHVKERVKLLSEVVPWVDYLMLDEIERDLPAMFKKGVDKEKASKVLELAIDKLSAMETLAEAELENTFREIANTLELKAGPAFMVVRIALGGKKVTLPLIECMVALGKEKTIKRFEETLELVRDIDET